MATPAKSVQCRDLGILVDMYKNACIPAFGIRQGGALNFVYPTPDMEDGSETLEEGADTLKQFAGKLHKSESAAIYTLCLYRKIPADGIDEKTPCSLSWNFKLHEATIGFASGEQFSGGYAQLLKEMADLKAKLKEKEEEEAGHKLGMIGEILEMDAMQPIVLGVATKLADWITGGSGKVGELARISGVPAGVGVSTGSGSSWREDPAICRSMDILAQKEKELPAVLGKLAELIVQKPTQWIFYKTMLMKLK